jgi:hypothetical protein
MKQLLTSERKQDLKEYLKGVTDVKHLFKVLMTTMTPSEIFIWGPFDETPGYNSSKQAKSIARRYNYSLSALEMVRKHGRQLMKIRKGGGGDFTYTDEIFGGNLNSQLTFPAQYVDNIAAGNEYAASVISNMFPKNQWDQGQRRVYPAQKIIDAMQPNAWDGAPRYDLNSSSWELKNQVESTHGMACENALLKQNQIVNEIQREIEKSLILQQDVTGVFPGSRIAYTDAFKEDSGFEHHGIYLGYGVVAEINGSVGSCPRSNLLGNSAWSKAFTQQTGAYADGSFILTTIDSFLDRAKKRKNSFIVYADKEMEEASPRDKKQIALKRLGRVKPRLINYSALADGSTSDENCQTMSSYVVTGERFSNEVDKLKRSYQIIKSISERAVAELSRSEYCKTIKGMMDPKCWSEIF